MNQRRTTWLFIVVAQTVLPILLVVILMPNIPLSGAQQGASGTIMLAVSIAALAASVWFAMTRLTSRAPIGERPQLSPPERFVTDSLIAMAFSELASLLGIFLVYGQTGSAALTYGLVGGTILINLFLIVPLGLAYWRSVQERGDV